MKNYTIKIWNEQGASEIKHCPTFTGCVAWLKNNWSDPQNFVAEIGFDDQLVARKEMGKKSFKRVTPGR